MERDVFDVMVDFLNDAIEVDRDAISELFLHRVPCNGALKDHPTIQVGRRPGSDDDNDVVVGAIGIVNGFCMTAAGTTNTAIGARIDDDGKINRFMVMRKQ